MAYESAQQPQFADNGSGESGKHIVIALVIAAAIVFGARQVVDHLVRPATASSVATQTAPSQPSTADSAAEDEQIAADARKARQAREQQIIEQDRALREQKKADAMRARDEAVAASQAEDSRKEAAWQRFYNRSKRCDAPADDAARVDCSNQYIRARERFEKDFADGKLH
jgi:hypothetical protein